MATKKIIVSKGKKVKQKTRIYRKKSHEKIRELEIQLDIEHEQYISVNKEKEELKRILDRNMEYTSNLEAEIAMTREKDLNLIEAINIISRAERLRIQSNLWGKPLTNKQLVNEFSRPY